MLEGFSSLKNISFKELEPLFLLIEMVFWEEVVFAGGGVIEHINTSTLKFDLNLTMVKVLSRNNNETERIRWLKRVKLYTYC